MIMLDKRVSSEEEELDILEAMPEELIGDMGSSSNMF